jgi:hypothetical protein
MRRFMIFNGGMVLSDDDFKNLRDLMKAIMDEDETIVRKEDIQNLPTKEEFFSKMDEVVGELKRVREEATILSDLNRKVNDSEFRIEKIEEKLNIEPAI